MNNDHELGMTVFWGGFSTILTAPIVTMPNHDPAPGGWLYSHIFCLFLL
jgi:hypothetical protein